MSKLSISIVMPVYNAERFLEESLKDVLDQSYSDFELICIDDGSSDKSGKILEKHAAEDDRIVVVHQNNSGAGPARNAGLDKACGEYILFLDADDRFEKDLLKEAYETAISDAADITIYGADCFDSLTGSFTQAPWLLNSSYNGRNPLKKTNTTVWNKMFKRELIDRNGVRFADVRIVDSMSFTFFQLLSADTISVCDKVLLHYRTGDEDSQLSGYYKTPLVIIDALKDIYNTMLGDDKWYKYRDIFFEFAISNLRIKMDMIKREEAFFLLYNGLHEGGLDSLGLTEEILNEYPDGSILNEVRTKGYNEYLFDRYIRLRNNGIISAPAYLMPETLIDRCKKKKIWLHGGGVVGRNYFSSLSARGINVLGWSDKDWKNKGFPVVSMDNVRTSGAEIIVLAVEDEIVAGRMREDFKKAGIDDNAIIWERPIRI